MTIKFEFIKGETELSPIKFHILPTITYMWHPKGRDTLYIGWLVFTLIIKW